MKKIFCYCLLIVSFGVRSFAQISPKGVKYYNDYFQDFRRDTGSHFGLRKKYFEKEMLCKIINLSKKEVVLFLGSPDNTSIDKNSSETILTYYCGRVSTKTDSNSSSGDSYYVDVHIINDTVKHCPEYRKDPYVYGFFH
jgi:hypothetical protein